MATMNSVVLHILENENENSRCLGRVPCNGVANLGEFRAFLEGFKEKPIVPWNFDFWDSKLNRRIATELEQINTLELHDHVVTVIRPHGQHSNAEQDLQEETSSVMLEPKHTIFLSHSGIQKPFVEQLCKDLEAQNHYPFFDQRSSSLPIGEKFSSLIIDAAKNCKVAVVVLSREYLSSKWPMLELVEFVRTRRSENESLKLLPLFYKASSGDLSNGSIQNQWMRKWVELIGGDSRVDLELWVAAVRELRGVNGLSFDKFGNSEVSYRDAIVKEILRLAPPELPYETSKICGRDRICEMLGGRFLPHTSTSAEVLGLYGMGGLGKTTMSKCLCNHFNQLFLGRVCYIEIKEEVKVLERQQMVMRKLLRLNDLLVQSVRDVSEGWGVLQSRMKKDPVFLVIDNVQFDGASEEEARAYLNLGHNSGSKILVISRSSEVVEDLLGDSRYCCELPRLTRDEAAGVFLQHGAPFMDYSSLTEDERRVVDNCLEEACFSNQGPWYRNGAGQFHPLALRALGVYLYERSKPSNLLSWDTYLHEYGKLKGTRESYMRMFKILGLQFNTFDRATQLMFLDTCLYASKALESDMLSNSPLEELIGWLANVHGELAEVVRSKIFDFKRFDMINIEGEKIIIHDLYKEYAIWFLKQVNGEEEVRGVWCVGKCGELDSSLPLVLQGTPPGRCWPNLKRIRLENMWCNGFPVGKVQEWCNIVVLQILRCENLTTIDLQGLTCLRHLELKYLKDLKTFTFTGDGSSSSASNVVPPLQFLIIDGLYSVECLPSFNSFTSLKFLEVVGSGGLTQPPSFEHCSSLERVWLSWYPNQKTLPSLYGLTSLRDLTILNTSCESYEGRALELEGLSSLISLGALELYNIPVGDLSGLENLTRVEYIYLSDMRYLTCLPPLENLARSSLHVLELWGWVGTMERLDELKSLIKLKLEGLAARGEIVPHTPSKIWARMRRIRFADEQMSQQGDSSRQGHCPSISNLMSVKPLQRTASFIDSASSQMHAGTVVSFLSGSCDGETDCVMDTGDSTMAQQQWEEGLAHRQHISASMPVLLSSYVKPLRRSISCVGSTSDLSKIFSQEGWLVAPACSHFHWSQSWRLPRAGQGMISFEARGMNSVHVAIFQHRNMRVCMYEVFIGWSGKTTSVMQRSCDGGTMMCCSVAAGLTHPEGINRLWLSVDDTTSVIQVGRGEPWQDVIITYMDPCFLSAVQFVTFTSWDTSAAYSNVTITRIQHVPPVLPTSKKISQAVDLMNGKWEMAANLLGQYTWAQHWVLPRAGRGILSFVAYSSGEVYLGISSRPCTVDPMYEVVFNWWSGRTVLRKRSQGSVVCQVDRPHGLTPKIWVLVDDRTSTIQIGLGVPCQDMFFIYKDASFLSDAQYFTFTTWDCSASFLNVAIVDILD